MKIFMKFMHMMTVFMILALVVFFPTIVRTENTALNNFASDMIVAIYDHGATSSKIEWEPRRD